MNRHQQRAVLIARKIIALLSPQSGQSEKDVASFIRQQLKKYHARPSFRIIVASGHRSALPHGRATARKMRRGDLVVIDFGALYNGYRSDVTRTFVIGPANPRQKKVLRVVAQAQRRAIQAVRAGERCSAVDRAARGSIERQGFGKYFVHSTGHGIGKRVHQSPKISRKNDRRLKTGQVVTIEPGIYIKGWGGVRIEDMVEVKNNSCRVLTQ